MREVRMADINFITAHWIGWGSRTRFDRSGKPKALLASPDPVAIDFVAAQEVLMPLVPGDPRIGFIYSFARPFQALNNVIVAEQQYAGDAVFFIIDTRHLKNVQKIRTNSHFTGIGQAH